MGNFFIVASSKDYQDESGQWFQRGLEAARRTKGLVPSRTIEKEWVRVASFARQNGSGMPIVVDPRTGSWLVSSGTWFHMDDCGSGEELHLLSRYLEVGPHQLAVELEGFFVVVIGDAKTQEIFVVTDIVGSCHCFCRSLEHAVAISCSSLVLAGLDDFSLDTIGCQEFVNTGIIYEDRTFYREIKKMGPAAVFRLSEGALKDARRYWQITDIEPDSLDGRSAANALWESLTCASQKVGRIFSRPVCDLTGGHDSRATVAAFLASGTDFSTVVSGPAESPDVVISRSLAQLVGLSTIHIEPESQSSFEQAKKAFLLTDGECNIIEYARVLAIHQHLSERFDISINGSFGEVARGYWWELLFPRTGSCRKLDARVLAGRRYAAYHSDGSIFPADFRLDLVSHFADIIERTNVGLSSLPNTLQMDNAYLMMRMQRWQGRIASSTNQLWPCLSPFIFRSVLETMLRSSTRIRRRSLLIRRMLADFQPKLAYFPLEHGYPAMPCTWKNFYRFWPISGYYAGRILKKALSVSKFNRFLQSSASGDMSLRLQLWRQEEVRELLNPATMKLGVLTDRSGVTDFMRRSRKPHFPFDSQWSRVLSLEYALRVLEEVKSLKSGL